MSFQGFSTSEDNANLGSRLGRSLADASAALYFNMQIPEKYFSQAGVRPSGIEQAVACTQWEIECE